MKTYYDNLNKRLAAAKEQLSKAISQEWPGETLPFTPSPQAAKPSLAPVKTPEPEAKQAA